MYVMVNGSPTDEFKWVWISGKRTSLSPLYLFIIEAEELNVTINSSMEHEIFEGYDVGFEHTFIITRLQFVDNTLIMGDKS